MKKSEIQVGGRYIAKVSGCLVTVRVDEIRSPWAFSWRSGYSRGVAYEVTNLTTNRRTTFRSAAKFRRSVPTEVQTQATEVS